MAYDLEHKMWLKDMCRYREYLDNLCEGEKVPSLDEFLEMQKAKKSAENK